MSPSFILFVSAPLLLLICLAWRTSRNNPRSGDGGSCGGDSGSWGSDTSSCDSSSGCDGGGGDGGGGGD